MTTDAEIVKLIERLEAIRDHDWRVSFLAHTSDSAAEAATLIRALASANAVRPDYPFTCQECGRAHILDTSLPSEIWNQIAEPSDMLCTVCIDKRLAAKGLIAEAEFYYAGKALVSRLYTDSHGEVAHWKTRAEAAEADRGAMREALNTIAEGRTDRFPGAPKLMESNVNEFRHGMWTWSQKVAKSALSQSDGKKEGGA